MADEALSLETLKAEGIYDPDALDADDRAYVLERIIELGGQLDEIREAHRRMRLPSLMVQLILSSGRRLTQREVADGIGVAPEAFAALWRGFGFPDPGDDELRFSETDVEVMQVFKHMREVLGEDTTFDAARAIGTSMARVAEAEIASLRSRLEEPLRAATSKSREVHVMFDDIITNLLHAVERSFTQIHRHHIVEIARRYEEWQVPTSRVNAIDLVVGFADLVGSTELAEELELEELDRAITRFEAKSTDLIAASGATLVKRLGDAVMFVTPAAGTACDLALDLVDSFAADPEVPALRVGLAAGEVAALRGDYYGRAVNWASRLSGVARPSEILVAPSLRIRVVGVSDDYVFDPAPVMELAGIDGFVQPWVLQSREPAGP